jgi:hypothetical protein
MYMNLLVAKCIFDTFEKVKEGILIKGFLASDGFHCENFA